MAKVNLFYHGCFMHFPLLSKQSKLILTAGFALFAMFFGSGNLVFPLGIGVDTKSNFLISGFALLVTGILVPFLGLYSVILCNHQDNKKEFFDFLGPRVGFIMALAMLSLLGPFAVGPRCILVAGGGLKLLMPGVPDVFLSALLCTVVYILLCFRVGIIDVIGKILTPCLLGCVLLITIVGLLRGEIISQADLTKLMAFRNGLNQGYQTMDLLAAFFFATTTLGYFKYKLGPDAGKDQVMSFTLKASIIGASLLAIVYLGFIALGAIYSEVLIDVSPEQRIVVLAGHVLGNFSIPLVSSLICLACLTTICVLTDLFANFLQNKILRGLIGKRLAVFITLGVTFFISLIGFSQLANFLAVVLLLFYPALIVFSISLVFQNIYKYKYNISRMFFWATAGASLIVKLS